MVKRVLVLTVFFLGAFCVMGRQKKAPAPNADEKAVRAEAVAWFKAGAARDAAGFSSYYAPDATLLPPGAPLVSGKERITAYWASFFKEPGLALSGGPVAIEVANSGDLACERGTFKLTVNDASGKPVISAGKYVVVWKKQSDGKWKAFADTFNFDK